LNRQRNAEDRSTPAYDTAAPVLNFPAVAVNDLSHDPEPESVPLSFVAFERIKERLPHRLRDPSSIVRNRDDGISPTYGDTDMEIPGVWQCFDGVEQKIRNHLEDLTPFHTSPRDLGRPHLQIDSLL
jgi:hypothetical protein